MAHQTVRHGHCNHEAILSFGVSQSAIKSRHSSSGPPRLGLLCRCTDKVVVKGQWLFRLQPVGHWHLAKGIRYAGGIVGVSSVGISSVPVG